MYARAPFAQHSLAEHAFHYRINPGKITCQAFYCISHCTNFRYFELKPHLHTLLLAAHSHLSIWITLVSKRSVQIPPQRCSGAKRDRVEQVEEMSLNNNAGNPASERRRHRAKSKRAKKAKREAKQAKREEKAAEEAYRKAHPECSSCGDEFPNGGLAVFDDCEHEPEICAECLEGWVESQLDSTVVEARSTCPST